MSATSTQARNIKTMISPGLSSASAAPAATRSRKAASARKRSRTDEVSAQPLSLILLFTRPRPLARAEDQPPSPRPRLQRIEPVFQPPSLRVERQAGCGHALIGLLGRLLALLARLGRWLDQGLLLASGSRGRGRRRGRRRLFDGLLLSYELFLSGRLLHGGGASRKTWALPPGEVFDQRDEQPRDCHHQDDQRGTQVREADGHGQQDEKPRLERESRPQCSWHVVERLEPARSSCRRIPKAVREQTRARVRERA